MKNRISIAAGLLCLGIGIAPFWMGNKSTQPKVAHSEIAAMIAKSRDMSSDEIEAVMPMLARMSDGWTTRPETNPLLALLPDSIEDEGQPIRLASFELDRLPVRSELVLVSGQQGMGMMPYASGGGATAPFSLSLPPINTADGPPVASNLQAMAPQQQHPVSTPAPPPANAMPIPVGPMPRSYGPAPQVQQPAMMGGEVAGSPGSGMIVIGQPNPQGYGQPMPTMMAMPPQGVGAANAGQYGMPWGSAPVQHGYYAPQYQVAGSHAMVGMPPGMSHMPPHPIAPMGYPQMQQHAPQPGWGGHAAHGYPGSPYQVSAGGLAGAQYYPSGGSWNQQGVIPCCNHNYPAAWQGVLAGNGYPSHVDGYANQSTYPGSYSGFDSHGMGGPGFPGGHSAYGSPFCGCCGTTGHWDIGYSGAHGPHASFGMGLGSCCEPSPCVSYVAPRRSLWGKLKDWFKGNKGCYACDPCCSPKQSWWSRLWSKKSKYVYSDYGSYPVNGYGY